MHVMCRYGLKLKELPVDLPNVLWPIMALTLRKRTLSPLAERFYRMRSRDGKICCFALAAKNDISQPIA
jgi:hypothetical protein